MALSLGFDEVDQLVTDLTNAGLASVTVEPADVIVPGVWVRVSGIGLDLLGGYSIPVELFAIAGDHQHRRALGTLAELLEPILTVVEPDDGELTTTGVVLPGQAQALPAIRVPVRLVDCNH